MLAQFQKLSITSLDELVISPSLFIDFINDANDVVHPVGALYTSTVQLLRYSFWLAEQKAKLTKQEYKDLLKQLGWESEEKAYLKVDAAFNMFAPYQLAQIEPRTIFLIALNLKKYQSVITQMLSLPIITQDKVRSLMKKCHKPRAKKESEEATIWRMMPDQKRACVIGPIYNQAAGVMLEEMVKAQGKTGEAITEQAIIYFYNNEFKKSAEIIDVVETITETATCEAPIEVTVNKYDYWDADQVVVEEDLNSETLNYELDYDVDEDSQDNWSFELEENDDDIEDYEMLTTVGAKSVVTTAPVCEEVETMGRVRVGENVVSTSPTPKMAPYEELVQALQAAKSWQEISVAFHTYEEYKHEAWNALKDVERRRILEMTPPTIRRLSCAKREGLIVEFRMEREGVYHVRENGSFMWDIVFEYRVEEYLGRLVNQSAK